jgi:hypothetical protein
MKDQDSEGNCGRRQRRLKSGKGINLNGYRDCCLRILVRGVCFVLLRLPKSRAGSRDYINFGQCWSGPSGPGNGEKNSNSVGIGV